jgi:hypothetical protein
MTAFGEFQTYRLRDPNKSRGTTMTEPLHHPYVPETLGELDDYLAMVMLSSPTYKDYDFPYRNVQTVFYSLNAGIEGLRRKLGEERSDALLSLSQRVQRHFEADPQCTNGETMKGRELVREMEDILRAMRKKAARSDKV